MADNYWNTMFGFLNREDRKMIDDSLSDTQQKLIGKDVAEEIADTKKPQPKLRIVGIDDVLASSVFEKEVWNKAIDAVIAHYDNDEFIAKDLGRLRK